VLRARLLAEADRSRLDLTIVANPGRFVEVEGMLVHDREQGFWLVTDDDAVMLDDTLWAGFHEDPSEDVLGRLRITIEAA
jgi:hypothetical protein